MQQDTILRMKMLLLGCDLWIFGTLIKNRDHYTLKSSCLKYKSLILGDDVTLKFVGRTVSTKSLVLITIKYHCDAPQLAELIVNCEKMVIGGLLLKDIKEAISE